MRCVECRSTGFTQEELEAHETKTGHVRHPDPKEWMTSKEFPEQAASAPKLSKDDLLAALRDMGPAALAELRALLGPQANAPEDAKATKGGA